MNKELIEYLYAQMIKQILSKVSIFHRREIKEGYLAYLNFLYGEKVLTIKDMEYEKKKHLNFQKVYWESASQHDVLRELSIDKVLNEIEEISFYGNTKGKEKLESNTNTLDIDEANLLIKKLNKLIKKVKPFNEKQAQWYVSEGIMDLFYASRDTDKMSFRLYDEYKKHKNKSR